MKVTIEPIKPLVGGIVHVDKAHLADPDVVATVREALEDRGVLLFPQINVSDAEQLAFTDAYGVRAKLGRKVAGFDYSSPDVYTVTLDLKINTEPDYVLGTFFWHMDGVTADMPMQKATILSARSLSAEGGATEFSNLFAAYEALPEDEKKQYADLKVIHTVEAAVRPVYGQPPEDRLERWRNMAPAIEHPLIWTHPDGRKSLLLGTHADGIVGMPGPHGRALITRLIQWCSQPEFVYRHQWTVGDLVIWNNLGMMHRVVPYMDPNRKMHRTTVEGELKPGKLADPTEVARILEPFA